MTITLRVLPDFAEISHDFHSDFTRFSKFNNFLNFEARNLLDHLTLPGAGGGGFHPPVRKQLYGFLGRAPKGPVFFDF